MDNAAILGHILDAIPYPIVFVDCQHMIRYLNRRAKYHYHQERGYGDLIGRSLFECHGEESRERIEQAVERMSRHGGEEFLKVNARNERIFITPVRDDRGDLIGYFERFEANYQRT